MSEVSAIVFGIGLVAAFVLGIIFGMIFYGNVQKTTMKIMDKSN